MFNRILTLPVTLQLKYTNPPLPPKKVFPPPVIYVLIKHRRIFFCHSALVAESMFSGRRHGDHFFTSLLSTLNSLGGAAAFPLALSPKIPIIKNQIKTCPRLRGDRILCCSIFSPLHRRGFLLICKLFFILSPRILLGGFSSSLPQFYSPGFLFSLAFARDFLTGIALTR